MLSVHLSHLMMRLVTMANDRSLKLLDSYLL